MAGLRGRATYSPRDIDFLVAHLVPLDVWYLLPVEDCIPGPMLRFYPHRKAKEMRLELPELCTASSVSSSQTSG
jgi:hypothetical protein